ncbi:MAG: hypothetical protein ABI970_20265 [Chloroflexota bacterium]
MKYTFNLKTIFYVGGLVAACLVLVGCQPNTSEQNLLPTAIPFPTVTPGREIKGVLPNVVGIPLNGVGLSNPATAVALANLPTATPDYKTCPGSGNPTVDERSRPTNGRTTVAAVLSYLTNGGAPATVGDLLSKWDLLGKNGAVRADVDFTGEGTPDVLMSYVAPDDGGTLTILSCVAGQYTILYQAVVGGDAPQIIDVADINADSKPDVLFDSYGCSSDDKKNCTYRTQLITWQAEDGQFISLLNGPIISSEPLTFKDVDNDRIQELVVKLTDTGNASTGPLRTGINIYDWNGTGYVLSIVQLDPPQFLIQVVQEGDSNFARQAMDKAIPLYQQALTSTSLRFWLNDEPTYIKSYIYYKLLLAQAYADDKGLLTTFQTALAAYPDPNNAPVYVAMINSFWNGFQVTNNLHSACQEVQAIINTRPDAIGLLNRYGNRSPVIAAQDLCPF